MGIGVRYEEVISAASIVGCSTFSHPFNYIGVKVGAPMSRLNSRNEVTDKISSRLSKWKLKTLSIEGRLTLLKSVLTAILLYHMSLFKAPVGILNRMESVRRDFLNGVDMSEKKIAWICWENFLASKKNEAIHGIKGALANQIPSNRSSPWIDLVRECNSLNRKGEVALRCFLPRLFALKLCKDISVAEKFWHFSLDFSFRHSPKGGADTPTRLVKLIPIKVNVLAWRICLDRLPTRLNLSFRGLEIPSILCPLCNEAAESTYHLFFSSSLARQIMRLVCRWWELELSSFNSYDEWLIWLSNSRLSKLMKEILEGTCYVTWWTIWHFSN
ncbi:RNA-directed DNA polymerase, eukaryota, reverse transcriptase zinc-binding domain protein [Tanacetum coccineum]